MSEFWSLITEKPGLELFFAIIHKIEVLLKTREFLRDGRNPIPISNKTSELFSKIHGKNTKPELFIRKALWRNKLRGYRLWPNLVPGRPDICFTKYKIAIFVNGCFWHRCPKCNPPFPKTHEDFWREKFAKNVARDHIKNELLEEQGWKVFTVWECEIKNYPEQTLRRLIDAITQEKEDARL